MSGFSVFFVNCKKESVSIPKPPVIVQIKDTSIVNRFIFTGLKDYYLWSDQVPTLTTQKYSNSDSLNVLLNSFSNPQKFFTSLLYRPTTVDKWSFLVNDSTTINNLIQGISETMGYDFWYSRLGNTNNVVVIVKYVYKGSPAEKAGIRRGNFFMKVNGTQLTVSNWQQLLFNNLTYTLSMASISGKTVSLNGNSVTMTAVTMQENPIQLDTIFMVNNLRIGYLVYNAFNSDYDFQLNDVFKKFKEASIDKLILDLRYNGGGDVQTAKYLASMIYGPAISKVLYQEQYNTGLQEYITSVDGIASLSSNFTDKIMAKTSTTQDTPINALNLNELYVITTNNTASASELLINCLKPYMTIFSVGTTTVGKYVASWTIKDWDNNGNVNPKDPYEMQLITVKIANSRNDPDFINGLTPDFVAQEDIANLLPFGDPNESLLKPVLDKIQGLALATASLKSEKLGLTKEFDSMDQKPLAKQMFVKSSPKKYRK